MRRLYCLASIRSKTSTWVDDFLFNNKGNAIDFLMNSQEMMGIMDDYELDIDSIDNIRSELREYNIWNYEGMPYYFCLNQTICLIDEDI